MGKFFFQTADACNIVHGNIVEFSQNDEAVHGYPRLAALVIGIGALDDVEQVCDFLLCQKMIFPDFPDTFVIFDNKYLLPISYCCR